MPVLRAEALSFRFDTRTMFDGLSLALPSGVTWLRCANGKGKTTLLKLLGGALAPHAGSIRLDGLDSARDALPYRRSSFLCSGDTPALPWLTVRELLDLHVTLFALADGGEVARQLDAFGVADTLAQPLQTLSLGQHKKVQLALALALPVRLLLLDEPFNGLDAPAVLHLREQLAARSSGACIVLTSHVDPQLALAGTLDL
jgi:ABC-type multidrug transport system ATPase subunit